MSTPLPVRSDFRFVHRLRVRWAEVDMQKIVFNGHYLMYLDTAMSDYWRALALPYEEAMQYLGGDIYVKKVGLEYHASAQFDDVLDIGLRCARVGKSSMLMQAGVFRGDKLLVSGELVYVFADPATQTSKPVPAALRSILEGYEAGEKMTTLQVDNWQALQGPASALREEVFAREQGIASELMTDALDATARHALVLNRLGQPIAGGRLLQESPGVGRIGRMAVKRALRGGSFGRDVLNALVQAARERGDVEVMMHAQCSAEGFYRRQGCVSRGAVFEEAGLQHIEMVLPL